MRLYYLGPEGTFSQEAATYFAGLWPDRPVNLVPLPSIAAVIERTQEECAEAVESEIEGSAPFASIPLENTIHGGVTTSWDLLGRIAFQTMDRRSGRRAELQILATHTLAIEHFLLTVSEDVQLTEIEEVFSKAEALAQCQTWLSQHLPHARLTAVESTGQAARHVREGGRRQWAAIGSYQAAEVQGLAAPYTCLPASEGNQTRFGLVGLPALTPGSVRRHEGRRKRSLVLEGVPNRPGGLFDTLRVFASKGFNLSRIESRPSGTGLGTYIFFVDVDWDPAHSNPWRQVRAELAEMGIRAAHLGLYPEV
ncbi:MAG: ACT domain-containing protein [Alicyclobacillus herbarius]|uniref:prephenate dehydratase n=1 Tax=Alicyclobacillus herbarius TaxID=122960 RepID=UPI00040E56B5|nr:prephenate dehydratase domain-containing protein [Alicyclobacillus herbarius]MCL6632010.1 ACT domain-containing protein [Alicyclobacillus herbarius]